MSRPSAPAVPAEILDVVAKLLESKGYDGWQLRDVADQARVSLATVYKHFPSRDDLIVAAVERWMADHVYRPMHVPAKGQSVFEAMNDMFRSIFEPWEDHPEMLQVFLRASATATGRDRLRAQGSAGVEVLWKAYADRLQPSYAADLTLILTNVVAGALSRYLHGDIVVTEILPILERTLLRLEQAAHTTVIDVDR